MAQASSAELYSDLASDPDLADIVQMFVDEMPGRVEKLVQCYDRHDLESLARTAHQLKGSAGSYGFQPITPAAARLETAVRSHAPEQEIEASLAELVELCHRIRGGIDTHNA